MRKVRLLDLSCFSALASSSSLVLTLLHRTFEQSVEQLNVSHEHRLEASGAALSSDLWYHAPLDLLDRGATEHTSAQEHTLVKQAYSDTQ
jgi:hypothetical protein